MVRIRVHLDPQREEQLEAAAKAEGVSPSAVVRDALRTHLGRKGSPPNCIYLAWLIPEVP